MITNCDSPDIKLKERISVTGWQVVRCAVEEAVHDAIQRRAFGRFQASAVISISSAFVLKFTQPTMVVCYRHFGMT
jgi:hypothetical protein